MVSLRAHLAGGPRGSLRSACRGPGFWGLVLGCLLPNLNRAADTNALLHAWFSAQTNLQSWSARFTQTRTLRALVQPLTVEGRVWVAFPDRFRWELGEPAQTIAVRRGEEMWVIYPRLKRAERYSLAGTQPGPWRDALALLEAGFPRSRAELESRFRILALVQTNEVCRLSLQPKSASARRLMSQIQVNFDARQYSLLATEVTFADGSRLRNDYAGAVVNSPMNDALFQAKLEQDVTVVDPSP
jgi:outer membrane lipoprotein-sorting protein